MDNVIKFRKREWQNFYSPDYAVQKSGETFAVSFGRYLTETKRSNGVTQKYISDISGVHSTLITMYKNGLRTPTLNVIVILSIAMRLTPEKSDHLFYTAGFQLNNSMEHRIYRLFLQGCAFNDDYSIENCNAELLKHGFCKLTI